MLHRFVLALLGTLLAGSTGLGQALRPGPVSPDGRYVLIGWNELGMHCLNGRFADMCILPPANTFRAVVIERGNPPRAVVDQLTVTYDLVTNHSVEQHTDFWQFTQPLFGVTLPRGVGLSQNRTTGTMAAATDYFEASFVPALPTSDNGNWNPYQPAILKLYDANQQLAAQARIVIPVSDEMNCQKCHASGKIAAKNIAMPTLEQNILTLHDKRHKTDLMHQRPVLCAKCHSDNALGLAGKAGVSSLSLAMHRKHASIASRPNCYDCHPGANTQCNRSALPRMGGISRTRPNCENCHGNLPAMASGLAGGRQPWLQEPSCTQCHDSEGSTGTMLYRQARGHGGLLCVTCHNSPHAWWPSKNAADNELPMAIQGNKHALGHTNCQICHTDNRHDEMPPHGSDIGGD